MRALVFICSLLVCGPVFAEAHIGFEVKMKTVARSWGNPNGPTKYAAIDRFYAGGKARHAELFPGSAIVGIDNVPVKDWHTIHRYCKNRKRGDKVVLWVWRNQSADPIEVELVEGEEMRKGGFLEW